MSNKRSKRKKVKSFSCPFCETRLWRLGSPKYHLFYKNAGEMRRNLQISAKKASFLANQSSTCLDNKTWIEEFFCRTHGRMWLYLSHRNQEELSYRLAKREDWQQTDKTFDPSNRNPSISEFSYRVSRKGYYKFK
ncbi:conserved hypothetical protein [Hyella patelloides LEGE 07179]|uniref:Uncharacterized protein n=2 Tax=Hyella TaxID=945733 RepID=A0A563VMW5_9CYAN|nr:conserved hypothetical protein [Hyella patelloides LEGE 07179]